MKTYAVEPRVGTIKFTGWLRALALAKELLDRNPDECIRIYLLRGGERHARALAEVSDGSIRLLEGGMTVPSRKLARSCE